VAWLDGHRRERRHGLWGHSDPTMQGWLPGDLEGRVRGLDTPPHHPCLRRLPTRRRVPREAVRVMVLPQGMVPVIGPPAQEKDHADP